MYYVHSLLGTGVQEPLIKRACGVRLLPCFAVLIASSVLGDGTQRDFYAIITNVNGKSTDLYRHISPGTS